eukprot:3242178-Lingulodinium_polyedra.AAC.1
MHEAPGEEASGKVAQSVGRLHSVLHCGVEPWQTGRVLCVSQRLGLRRSSGALRSRDGDLPGPRESPTGDGNPAHADACRVCQEVPHRQLAGRTGQVESCDLDLRHVAVKGAVHCHRLQIAALELA